MTFFREAMRHAIEWKQSSPLLTEPAREPAAMLGSKSPEPYPHCLPPECAAENLLPSARQPALTFFHRHGIPWQAGGFGRPSNNLLSSQTQCANVFAPVMRDADAVKSILGSALPIDRVLPWPTGEFLTFEWIGEEDYLGEARPGEARTRGSLATSDLAVRYRASSGDIEIALMEWKYVEGTYDPELGPGNDKRMARHRRRFDAPDGPVRQDMIAYPNLFVDPFYQLFRLTLLAFAMEQAGEHDARNGTSHPRRPCSQRSVPASTCASVVARPRPGRLDCVESTPPTR